MIDLAGIPFLLTTSDEALWKYSTSEGLLSARAMAKSDLYCNPNSPQEVGTLNALRLIGTTEPKDLQISAKVSVDFDSWYDAGTLLIWENDQSWAKLCFEYSPDREAMVVSVVTHGTSDDANSFTLTSNEVWLRISRIKAAYAFHASTDGSTWKLIRVFTLGDSIARHQIGFVAQAPIGDGCEVRFSEIRFAYSTLTELRDGS